MNRPPRIRPVLIALALIAVPGCEGFLVLDTGGGGGGEGGPGTPNVYLDAGPEGMPPSPPGDGGPGGSRDAGGPGGGCDLPAQGQCDGSVARWCEGTQERSQDCGTTGEICQLDESLGRVACAASGPPPPTGCGSAEELAVIELANQARASAGAGPLECDEDMARAARLHSQDMCNQGYFSHNSLDGRSPFDRMRDEGVSFGAAGENIAQGQSDADAVHQAWMGSSGHRANILNGSFRRIGVGLEECDGRMYWTQNFAD